jgi:ketosteroid isomerase-like protein
MTRMCVVVLMLLTMAPSASAQTGDAAQQVREAERAFAKTMADRDHTAFTSFLADEAIFLGPKEALRGKQAVAAGWKRFFDGKQAPFAWEPERVEVVSSGNLAISTGPVTDPASGKRVGTFTTTWRREPDGKWRVVLDSGCPPCNCK